MLKYVLLWVDKYCQFTPGLLGPWYISAGELFSVLFYHIDKYIITVSQIMIVEPIAALIEKDFLVRHNNEWLVSLHAIIHATGPSFAFKRGSMFAMHLSSNQTVPNPGSVASVLMIIVPGLQCTWTILTCVLQVSFTSSLFMKTFTTDWLFIISQHGLTNLLDPWVSFHLFGNECLSVSPRMSLLIPVMLESTISGSLIGPLTTSNNRSEPSTSL